jgi:hypothetical protein
MRGSHLGVYFSYFTGVWQIIMFFIDRPVCGLDVKYRGLNLVFIGFVAGYGYNFVPLPYAMCIS